MKIIGRIKTELIVLFTLSVVGVFVHFNSFKFAIYGDDWLNIFYFLGGSDAEVFFNTLPGMGRYFSAYGGSIFFIGSLYKLFGTSYSWYYVGSFLLKLTASLCLYLLVKQITKKITYSYLTSLLFLVGFTGVQSTDWAVYMNVYLAVAFFYMSIYFQLKSHNQGSVIFIFLNMVFAILAIVLSPVRLYPLILGLSILDGVSMVFGKTKLTLRMLAIKTVLFSTVVAVLWNFGLFGGRQKIYSPNSWSLTDFLNLALEKPFDMLTTFFYWLGVIIIPDSLALTNSAYISFGALFSLVLVFTLAQSYSQKSAIRQYLISSCVLFVIFFMSIWFFAPLRLIGSEDRYLLPVFATFCLLIGFSSHFIVLALPRLKPHVVTCFIILIFLHAKSVMSFYDTQLQNGRSQDYINLFDQKILTDLTPYPKPPPIIYLQADSERLKHSVIFGMSAKLAVLSGNPNQESLADYYDSKEELIKFIRVRSGTGSKDEVIASVYAYHLHRDSVVNITKEVRKILRLSFPSQ